MTKALIILGVSWLLRTYGAVQNERNPVERPVFWSDNALNILSLIWIIFLGLGIIFSYQSSGFWTTLLLVLIYFVILPILLGQLFKRVLNKLHL